MISIRNIGAGVSLFKILIYQLIVRHIGQLQSVEQNTTYRIEIGILSNRNKTGRGSDILFN